MKILLQLPFLAIVVHSRIFLEQDADPINSQWAATERASLDTQLKMTIAIKQRNLDKLERTLMAVSDPQSGNYGQHLTHEEIQQLVTPRPDSISMVVEWLTDHGITSWSSSSNNDFIQFVTSVATAEKLLEAEYHSFKHTKFDVTVIRTFNYSIPNKIKYAIDFISPTVRLPTLRSSPTPTMSYPPTIDMSAEKDDQLGANPTSLRKLYAVGTVEGNSSTNRQAVTAFLEQYYRPSDLQKFYEGYYTIAKGRTVQKVIGPNKNFAGIEASLDIEYITALGGNVPTQFWSFAGRAPDNPENEPFLDFLYLVANTSDDNVPYVFSTSYGEDEKSVSMDYANRINVEFQKAGTRGISILFASGDSGVAGDSGSCTRFVPQWPSGSPYVTAVGGTTTLSAGEKCAGLSSGGFSDRWPRPDWQKDAVEKFLSTSTHLPDKSRYNQTGRGFPDVSALATGFTVVNNGATMSGVAGTSCSSPTFSGIVGLLNDLRLQNGKSTLGFLNPWIYQSGFSALNDMTSGDNPGCGTRGFTAIAGWDPCSGYGTPDYSKLAKAVLELP